jgi:hypothetical protein
MSHGVSRSVTLTPRFVPTGPACCPACGSEAALHQPDPHLPDRLIMTCGCGAWTVLIRLPDGTGSLALSLPDLAALLACREDSPGCA